MPTRLALAAIAAVLLALPSTAAAATELGQTYRSAATCGADVAGVQLASAAPAYRVEAPGVITELRTEGQTASGMRLHVLRPRGSDSYAVLASAPVRPAPGVIRVPVRVPVQPGDLLGNSSGDDANVRCGVDTGRVGDVVALRTGAMPDAGETTMESSRTRRLNVAATLEPDADGDGYGDETQDRCPDDPSRATVACEADLFVGQSAAESDIERDDLNVITVAVRNNGSSPARDVRVVQSVPPGVLVLGATPSSGTCAGGAPVDCTFGTVPAGTTATVLVVVRVVTTGRKTVSATASSPTPDPNPQNNTGETGFDVGARRTVVDQAAFCRVPRLAGLTRRAARTALEAAGCRLGRTARRRSARGAFRRVRSQTIPAGTRVATRTRVGITVRRR